MSREPRPDPYRKPEAQALLAGILARHKAEPPPESEPEPQASPAPRLKEPVRNCIKCGKPELLGCERDHTGYGWIGDAICPLQFAPAVIHGWHDDWPMPEALKAAGFAPSPLMGEALAGSWRSGAKAVQAALVARQGAILWGSFGTGKSYLAAAFVNSGRRNGKWCLFVDARELIERLRGAIRSEEGDGRIVGALESCDLLVLDDARAARSTDFADDALIGILRKRHSLGRPTILTMNTDPRLLLQDELWGAAIDRLRGTTIRLVGASIRAAASPPPELPIFQVRPGETEADAMRREHRQEFAKEAREGLS